MSTEVVRTSDPGLRIEQRGMDYIPLEERYLRPRRLSWMWAGSVLNVTSFLYGTLLIAFGLSFVDAVIITVLGNLVSFAILGITSLAGARTGTNQLTISRAGFGINWNRFNAFSNWLLIVGFEVVGLSIIALAGLALLAKAGIVSSSGVKVAVILVIVLIQLPMPLFGHAVVVKAMKPISIVLGVGFVVMTILLLDKVHVHTGAFHGGVAPISTGIALVMSGAGLGWCAYGSDYTRYMPPDTPRARIFASTMLGPAIPQILLMVLGAAVATAMPSASNEIGGLPHVFPGWFVVPYLLIAMLSLFAVNSVNLYSSGLNLQTLGLRLKRWQAVCVDLAIATALTFAVVFSQRFNSLLSDFLLFALVWIVPWMAVYLTDWALRRGQYSIDALFTESGGLYWRRGGFNVPAIAAQVVGMVASLMWLNAYPVYLGPLSRATGTSDFDIFLAAGLAAAVYWVLARRSVRSEVSDILSVDALRTTRSAAAPAVQGALANVD